MLVEERMASCSPSSAEFPPAGTSREPSGPASSNHPPVKETAVMAALRRGEEEKRARDARRARLAEKAREGRVSPVVTTTATGGAGSTPPRVASPSAVPAGVASVSGSLAGSSSVMAPPAPFLPTPRQRGPHPLSLTGHQSKGTPVSSTKSADHLTPGRPGKRSLPRTGSPTDGESPRSRARAHPTPAGVRASSADGRLSFGRGAHPRVHFQDSGSTSSLEERF